MGIERSAAERLEGEHASGAAQAGWREDIRVDPERRRERLTEGVHAQGAFGAADVEHEARDVHDEPDMHDERDVHDTRVDDAAESGGYTYVDRRTVREPVEADEPAARASALEAREREEPAAAAQPAAATARAPDRVVRTLVRGALAGAIGALAMALTHRAASKVWLGDAGAAPNPAADAAEQLGERAGVELTGGQAAAGGTALMVGYGALLGAVYGMVQERVHPPALLHALALGGMSYAATVPQKGLLPRLGLAAPPTEQSLLAAMVPMDAHVAYGVATAAAYDALS